MHTDTNDSNDTFRLQYRGIYTSDSVNGDVTILITKLETLYYKISLIFQNLRNFHKSQFGYFVSVCM